MEEFLSLSKVSDMLSVSKDTLRRWDKSGKLKSHRHPTNDYRVYKLDDLKNLNELSFLFEKDEVKNTPSEIKPKRKYKTIELFAGAGVLALGLEE
jgi:DNA (cytosine-5)-methyltransferase 1